MFHSDSSGSVLELTFKSENRRWEFPIPPTNMMTLDDWLLAEVEYEAKSSHNLAVYTRNGTLTVVAGSI